MDINKASLTINGEGTQLNIGSPIVKIDKARRLVSGYATANNVDSQKDIVTTEASLRAFEEARGNIREMHGTEAVGKVVDYKVDKFVAKDGNTYEGIYVTAYISKGAPNAWEKVLDGTYSGFSIGGNITDSESEWRKDHDGTVRIVKGYDLIELSIVDNPANQEANIFSIQKAMTGQQPEHAIELENAFVCRTDEVARTSKSETLTCVTCKEDMEPMGWVETAGDKTKAVKSLMTKFLTPDTNEGGVTKMTDETKTTADSPVGDLGITDPEVVEAPTPEDVAVETPESDEEVKETPQAETTVSEDVNTDEPDFEKMLASVKEAVTTEIASLEGRIEEMAKAAEASKAELDGKLNEAMQKFDSAHSQIESVTKRLKVVEGKSAIRKSADVESVSNESLSGPEERNIWTGALLDSDLD
jgi:phage head maturation protease